jgi:hypothetical protein
MGPGCQTDPFGPMGSQRRTLCDGPVLPDGSWSRERTIWAPAWYQPGNCLGGSSPSSSRNCSPGTRSLSKFSATKPTQCNPTRYCPTSQDIWANPVVRGHHAAGRRVVPDRRPQQPARPVVGHREDWRICRSAPGAAAAGRGGTAGGDATGVRLLRCGNRNDSSVTRTAWSCPRRCQRRFEVHVRCDSSCATTTVAGTTQRLKCQASESLGLPLFTHPRSG